MLTGLKHLLDRLDSSEPDFDRPSNVQVAAAALLVEAATLEDGASDVERKAIVAALERGFGIGHDEAVALLAEGERRDAANTELYAFTRPLKDGLPPEERVRIIEMLWEVALADGEVSDYEASLLRRVAGLLYVEDRDSGLARQRVAARLGLQ